MGMAMMKHRTPSVFDELDESSSWEVVAAWVIVVLLVAATSVGLLLDQAVTISP
jgi:hypothetical protein